MKKLGEGWQYTVYDLGNGRVFKKFHPPLRMLWVIAKVTFPFQTDPLWKIPKFAKDMKEKAEHSFEFIRQTAIPREWLGNPTFHGGLDFEQDKVLPLFDVLEKADVEKAKEVIDGFTRFNRLCLTHGFMDKSFNITKNYGLTADGNIILVDIGELVSGSKEIDEQLRKRIWRKSYVAGCIADPRIKEYFLEQMDREFCGEEVKEPTA